MGECPICMSQDVDFVEGVGYCTTCDCFVYDDSFFDDEEDEDED